MQKVVITTAHPLSATVLKMITDKLTKHYGKDLEYKMVTDPSVVGGAKILVGTQEIDATVARKLEVIKIGLSQQT